MQYTITISDEAQVVIQKSFDTENARLTAAGLETHRDIDAFLSWVICKYYGVTESELAQVAQDEAIASVVEKLRQLPVESITTVSATVDIELDKSPVKGVGLKLQ